MGKAVRAVPAVLNHLQDRCVATDERPCAPRTDVRVALPNHLAEMVIVVRPNWIVGAPQRRRIGCNERTLVADVQAAEPEPGFEVPQHSIRGIVFVLAGRAWIQHSDEREWQGIIPDTPKAIAILYAVRKHGSRIASAQIVHPYTVLTSKAVEREALGGGY